MNMNTKNHLKVRKYTRVRLKIWINNDDKKYLKDQILLKLSIETKNKIWNIYMTKNLFNPTFKKCIRINKKHFVLVHDFVM
jgi:hypothetical protein